MATYKFLYIFRISVNGFEQAGIGPVLDVFEHHESSTRPAAGVQGAGQNGELERQGALYSYEENHSQCFGPAAVRCGDDIIRRGKISALFPRSTCAYIAIGLLRRKGI